MFFYQNAAYSAFMSHKGYNVKQPCKCKIAVAASVVGAGTSVRPGNAKYLPFSLFTLKFIKLYSIIFLYFVRSRATKVSSIRNKAQTAVTSMSHRSLCSVSYQLRWPKTKSIHYLVSSIFNTHIIQVL